MSCLCNRCLTQWASDHHWHSIHSLFCGILWFRGRWIIERMSDTSILSLPQISSLWIQMCVSSKNSFHLHQSQFDCSGSTFRHFAFLTAFAKRHASKLVWTERPVSSQWQWCIQSEAQAESLWITDVKLKLSNHYSSQKWLPVVSRGLRLTRESLEDLYLATAEVMAVWGWCSCSKFCAAEMIKLSSHAPCSGNHLSALVWYSRTQRGMVTNEQGSP